MELIERFERAETITLRTVNITDADARAALRRAAAIGVEFSGENVTVTAPTPRHGVECWLDCGGFTIYVQPGGGVIIFNDDTD